MEHKHRIRKAFLILGLAATITGFVISCDKLQSDHPQAKLDAAAASLLTERSIDAYADSVDNRLAQLLKKQSLIYERNDHSFSVTKYSSDERPLLYIERSDSADSGAVEKRYYIRDGEIVLYIEQCSEREGSAALSLKKLYYRNSVIFTGFIKEAEPGVSLEQSRFKAYSDKKDAAPDLARMEDALGRKGEFDLGFDNITRHPGARYIILSREQFNAYRAVIKVDKEDEFIKELGSNPLKHHGAKLHITWSLRDNNEAVYEKGALKPVPE